MTYEEMEEVSEKLTVAVSTVLIDAQQRHVCSFVETIVLLGVTQYAVLKALESTEEPDGV